MKHKVNSHTEQVTKTQREKYIGTEESVLGIGFVFSSSLCCICLVPPFTSSPFSSPAMGRIPNEPVLCHQDPDPTGELQHSSWTLPISSAAPASRW